MAGDLPENIGQIFLYTGTMTNNIPDKLLAWAEDVDYAVTICDTDCKILFMNRRSRETFAKHGDIIGKNLLDCHSLASRDKISHMLQTGTSNAYTISKGGVRKLIFQSTWKIDGKIAGLVETSMILPEDMPHYTRD